MTAKEDRHILALIAILPFFLSPARATPFVPAPVQGLDFSLVPESERALRRIILGLDANKTRPFMLPSTEVYDPRSMDPRVRHLRRELYWLAFEMRNGRILDAAPDYASFYVSVPDPRAVPESLGNEEEVFKEYLHIRLHWDEKKINRRIRFFKVKEPVVYPQDSGEPLGYDKEGRLVLGLGEDEQPAYGTSLRDLAQAYPRDYRLWDLGRVDSEGGDVELIWLPDGEPGLLLGRHRVRLWLSRKYGEAVLGRKLSRERVDEARAAFQESFFGLKVVIPGEDGLYDPALVSDDLFHADMVVNVLRIGKRATAFIPTYAEGALDLLTEQPLSENVKIRAQSEYDLVAGQFSKLGFDVRRIPFADHPVRSPANVGKYVETGTGKPVVLLGKYPYHRPGPDGRVPRQVLQAALDDLWFKVGTWNKEATDPHWEAVKKGLDEVWSAMDFCANGPNPLFEAQVRAFTDAGVRVVPVPIFPTGEGGLHCLYLTELPQSFSPSS